MQKFALTANSPCIKALKQSLDATILLHGMPVAVNVFGRSYVPVCDLNTGLFSPRQCYNTNCWCVNIYTGAELKNTYGIKGFVKCCKYMQKSVEIKLGYTCTKAVCYLILDTCQNAIWFTIGRFSSTLRQNMRYLEKTKTTVNHRACKQGWCIPV